MNQHAVNPADHEPEPQEHLEAIERLHRMLVLSATYQQSTRHEPRYAALVRDCLAAEEPAFGTVLIAAGREVGGGAVYLAVREQLNQPAPTAAPATTVDAPVTADIRSSRLVTPGLFSGSATTSS